MKSPFDCKLINEPFGDPGLYVSLRFERRAMLFDLGDVRGLSARQLLSIKDIFVSHTHLDHFVGFDELLRVCLGRDLSIRMWGPPGFIHQVGCKLAAYTWNLVEEFDSNFTLLVHEVSADGTGSRAKFCCKSRFRREDLDDFSFRDNVILDEPRLRVRVAFLDHKILCLGFCLEEKVHVGVRKNALTAMGFKTGDWLRSVKRAVVDEEPDARLFTALKLDGGERDVTLGELKAGCLLVGPGPHIGYVTDILFSEANVEAIIEILRGAELLFIESSFIAEETQRAAERYHLTTAQAGTIARRCGVKRVIPFHFSPKHLGQHEQILAEVRAAFRAP